MTRNSELHYSEKSVVQNGPLRKRLQTTIIPWINICTPAVLMSVQELPPVQYPPILQCSLPPGITHCGLWLALKTPRSTGSEMGKTGSPGWTALSETTTGCYTCSSPATARAQTSQNRHLHIFPEPFGEPESSWSRCGPPPCHPIWPSTHERSKPAPWCVSNSSIPAFMSVDRRVLWLTHSKASVSWRMMRTHECLVDLEPWCSSVSVWAVCHFETRLVSTLEVILGKMASMTSCKVRDENAGPPVMTIHLIPCFFDIITATLLFIHEVLQENAAGGSNIRTLWSKRREKKRNQHKCAITQNCWIFRKSSLILVFLYKQGEFLRGAGCDGAAAYVHPHVLPAR